MDIMKVVVMRRFWEKLLNDFYITSFWIGNVAIIYMRP